MTSAFRALRSIVETLQIPLSPFVLLRLVLVLLASLLALAFLERRWKTLTRFRNEKSTAVNLAVARIVVAAAFLWQIRLNPIVLSATLDPALHIPFRVWGRLALSLMAPPAVITAIYIIFVASAILMLIGLFGQAASAVTALTAVYLIAPLFLCGKVDHVYHHLIFFSVICAAFPSTDALSLDALIRASRKPRDQRVARNGLVYGYALRSLWIYIGLLYYFPGLWKFSRGWVGWLSGRFLHDHIALREEFFTWTPLQLWLLRHPLLIAVGSILVVSFELGFVFLILVPRWRPFVGLAGVAFHAAVYFVLHIGFFALAACYVIFFDWTPLLSRFKVSAETTPLANAPVLARATALAGLALMVVFGLLHVVDCWPFSCFPPFDVPAPSTVAQLSIQDPASGQTGDWSLSNDPSLRSAYPGWYWITRQGLGSGSSARPRVAALLRLWLHYHPEVHPQELVVSIDRYLLLPPRQVHVSRQTRWRFSVAALPPP